MLKLYNQFAQWWHLLSAPEECIEEANVYIEIIRKYKNDVKTCLEFGCGGGNNAFHMKNHLEMTLTDISPQMLKVSKSINPECQHIQGDMRSINLRQIFDCVFIHDAISYITDEMDLSKVFEVAGKHLNPGGLALIMPDDFMETFRPQTNSGGTDKDGRALRYLEWTHDPDPYDSRFSAEYAYIMKDVDGNVIYDNDHAEYGLFPMETWKSLISQSGFTFHFEKIEFSDQPDKSYFAILAIKS